MAGPARPALRPGRRPRARDAGWTLVELLVVLSIIMLIVSLAVASRNNAVLMGREAALRANLQMMRDGIDQFYTDTARYPDSLQELVSSGYLRQIPEDPFTNSSSTWRTEAPPTSFTSGRPREGVYNVFSTATSTGIDGTRVSGW